MENSGETFLEIISSHACYTATWTSAFRVSTPCIPLMAAFMSVLYTLFSQTASPSSTHSGIYLLLPFIIGSSSAGLLWIILASIFLRTTAVDTANAISYDTLCQHLAILDTSIIMVCEDSQDISQHTYELLTRLRRKAPSHAPYASSHSTRRLASTQVPFLSSYDLLRASALLVAYRDAIYMGLMQKTEAWTTGTGYIKLWRLMEQAEEIMLSFQSPEMLAQLAIYDDMRLQQSNIDNSAEWSSKLRAAVALLNENTTPYVSLFSQLPTSRIPCNEPLLSSGPQDLQSPSPSNPPPAPPDLPLGCAVTAPDIALSHADTTAPPLSSPGLTPTQARAILQLVHRIIAQFNAKNWNDILNARHQLLHTMTFASLIIYIALEMAILMEMNPHHLIGILLFGLIGALSGLFGRLYHESQADTEAYDYHLGTTRLMVTPLLSGLASTIGVLVVAKGTNLNDLSSAQNIITNFPLAATFGLTPNLVLNQLQRKSETYLNNIRSIQPTTRQ